MSLRRLWGLWLMAALYFLAGVNHFRVPEFYEPMIPPYFPQPHALVLWSGLAELILAIGLLTARTRRLAAWGVIAMLVIYFTVHVYMIQVKDTVFAFVPAWALYARIPLQFVLIAWAWTFARVPNRDVKSTKI